MAGDTPELLQEGFERQAAARPHAVALVHEGATLTYGELDAAADRLAGRLRAVGAGPGKRVAIAAARGVPLVAGMLGVLKAGGAYVPLDVDAPAARSHAILADCAPAAVLADAAGRDLLGGLGGAVLLHLEPDWEGWTRVGDGSARPPPLRARPRDAAYVIYTSGSTGQPKGVVVEHAQATALLAALVPRLALGAADTWALFHSAAFDFSVWELYGALSTGARGVIVPRQVARAGDATYRLVCAQGVTVLNQTPGALRQLLAAQELAPAPHQLRYLLVGGERVEPRLAIDWAARNAGAPTIFAEVYGPTECTVFTTCRIDARGAAPGTGIGTAIAGWRVYVLDEQLRPVPPGATGELWIGGAGVARGYLGRPALTADCFAPDPFCGLPGARMYRTGDLGRSAADGQLEHLGRRDAQVKVRGFRVEPGEVEAQLCTHPLVREAVVLPQSADGNVRLIAYFTAPAGYAPSPADLRAHMARRLPEYMVPAAYVRQDAFPLTLNGKTDRARLPAPGPEHHPVRTHAPPLDEMERRLAALWEELLQVHPVSRDDDFFELGGHSLLVVELVARIEEDLRIRVPMDAVFDTPRLREFAALVSNTRNG